MRLDRTTRYPSCEPMSIRYSSRVTDYGGSKAYAFWEATSYWPRIYFVRGDSWVDAYENFLQTLEIVGPDSIDLTEEDRAMCERGEIPPGYDHADGHGMVYSEAVQGCRIFPNIGGEEY